MIEKRPELSVGLKPEIFRGYYYLKKELQAFCQNEGLSRTGSKAELTMRIEHFLRTGECLSKIIKKKSNAHPEKLTLDSLIEENIVFSEVHRAFFKHELGNSFTFKAAFQKWLKQNSGKTYREAIAAYLKCAAQKPKKIDSQFEYNTYIRDFFADNQGRSLPETIACWKHKKAQPGSNEYQAADLSTLDSD